MLTQILTSMSRQEPELTNWNYSLAAPSTTGSKLFPRLASKILRVCKHTKNITTSQQLQSHLSTSQYCPENLSKLVVPQK